MMRMFPSKDDLKILGLIMICMAVFILINVRAELWLPFQEFFPEWFVKEPIIIQIGKLAPFAYAAVIIWGIIMLWRILK